MKKKTLKHIMKNIGERFPTLNEGVLIEAGMVRCVVSVPVSYSGHKTFQIGKTYPFILRRLSKANEDESLDRQIFTVYRLNLFNDPEQLELFFRDFKETDVYRLEYNYYSNNFTRVVSYEMNW